MGRRWLLLLAALGVLALNAVLIATFWPSPTVPADAPHSQRLYLERCATCHGQSGNGSWRATIFLIRPGNLTDRSRMAGLPDQYLFDIIKHGGAPLGKPGMPGFGFHLTDGEIHELVRYLRTLGDPSLR